jgi:hypothetical protein
MDLATEFYHPGDLVSAECVPQSFLQTLLNVEDTRRFWNCCLSSNGEGGCKQMQSDPPHYLYHTGFYDVFCEECHTATGEAFIRSSCNAPCAPFYRDPPDVIVYCQDGPGPVADSGPPQLTRPRKYRQWSCCGASARDAVGCSETRHPSAAEPVVAQ